LPVALALAVSVGIMAVLISLRITNCLEWEDRLRLAPLGRRLPAQGQRWLERIMQFLIPAPQDAHTDQVLSKAQHAVE
jgi:hypothetical protein